MGFPMSISIMYCSYFERLSIAKVTVTLRLRESITMVRLIARRLHDVSKSKGYLMHVMVCVFINVVCAKSAERLGIM